MSFTGITVLIIGFCLLVDGAPTWKRNAGKGQGNGNGNETGEWHGVLVKEPPGIINTIKEGQEEGIRKDAPLREKREAERSFLVNPGPQPDSDPFEHQGDDIVPNPKKEKRGIFGVRKNTWPNGEVPYKIEEDKYRFVFGAPSGQIVIDAIKAAIDDFHNFTCIKFVKHEVEVYYTSFDDPVDETDLLVFLPSHHLCNSPVGMIHGTQRIYLTMKCGEKGVVIHEILHALGFHHEQNRPDRDDYVTVLEFNIKPEDLYNFDKLDESSADTMGFGYDYMSVMHYNLHSSARFADKPTMKLTPGNEKWKEWVGQKRGFSSTDINEVNKKYGCPQPMIQPESNVEEH